MNNSISKYFLIAIAILFSITLLSFKSALLDIGDQQKKGFYEESFFFPINGGKQTLTGTLAIPEGFNADDKAVILVAPPGASSRDYSGLYSNLSKELVRNGIAVLRYDPRHVADTTLAIQSVTMFDQADDAESAYNALKKDKRFGPIGLLGHSEGGSSAAIVASRNKNIHFIALLSSPGISGLDFQLQNTLNNINKTDRFIKLVDGTEPDTVQNNLLYFHRKRTYSAIANISNIDSLYSLLKTENKNYRENVRKYHNTSSGKASMSIKERNEFDSVILLNDSLTLLNPRIIVLIQYQPELYYPKISCPVLAVFGKMDEIVFWEENSEGMESLFKKSQKENYEILLLDSINHEYRKVTDSLSMIMPPGIIQHRKESIGQQNNDFYIPAFSAIAEWINEMK
ncbi:Alpha/beta hydrolase family protein [Algoriphagus locisalis]|uniref:Alpha/beta hydrolase family protein n=1 Tax=Algoriphagus locisalis TaxID=305507 RepID=A0A1I7E489_9BACT|nr:alpha/beta fold hydrolase [Algoriphagus locisalis]SFU18742.1 Alpha/beta hydrolase family protein [Algoriphagus locisalis]